MKANIFKIKSAILVFIAVAIVIAQGCVPNGGGVSPQPTNNNRVKKSYKYIVQDNVNTKMNSNLRSMADSSINSEMREYNYNSLGQLINEKLFKNYPSSWLEYERNITRSSNQISVDEKYFSLLGGGSELPINYKLYFQPNSKRVDSIVRTTNSDGQLFTNIFVYTYDQNGRINKIENNNFTKDISTGIYYSGMSSTFTNFQFNNNQIVSYEEHVYFDSIQAQSHDYASDTTIIFPFTVEYSSVPLSNNFNYTIAPEQMGYFQETAVPLSNGLNYIYLLGLNIGSQSQTNMISKLTTIGTSSGGIYTKIYNYNYTLDTIGRVTNQVIKGTVPPQSNWDIPTIEYKYEY